MANPFGKAQVIANNFIVRDDILDKGTAYLLHQVQYHFEQLCREMARQDLSGGHFRIHIEWMPGLSLKDIRVPPVHCIELSSKEDHICRCHPWSGQCDAWPNCPEGRKRL